MPTNNAPTLTANALVDAPSVSYKSFLEGVATAGSPVNIFQLTSLSTIEAGQSILSLSFTVSGLRDGANEKVILGDGSALVSATILSLAGGSSGSMRFPSDGHYAVTVTGDVATITMTSTTGFTSGQTGALVGSMQYQNTNASNPTAGPRLFTLGSIQDSGGPETSNLSSIQATIQVAPTNDAPVLGHVTRQGLSIDEDAPAPNSGTQGTLLSTILSDINSNNGITDPDDGNFASTKGIAITATKYGTWFYSIDDGVNWTNINGVGGTVTSINALLLSADPQTQLYFQPSPNDSGSHSDGLIFYAWDGSTGSVGSKVPLMNRGGSSAFSLASDYASVTVNPINDAPVTIPNLNLHLSNPPTSAPVDGSNVGSTLVSSLVYGITDADSGAQKGLAITGTNETQGLWFYSLNDGVSWARVNGVDAGDPVLLSHALLLAADANTRLYFQANSTYNGILPNGLTVLAWDGTNGSAGSKFDITTQGGTSAFSSSPAYVAFTEDTVNDPPTLTALAVVDPPQVIGGVPPNYKSFLEGVATAGSPVNVFQLTGLSTIEPWQSIKMLQFRVSGLLDGDAEKVILGDGSALVSATVLSLTTPTTAPIVMKIADATYTVSVADDLLSDTKTATVTMTSETGFSSGQTGALVASIQYQNTNASNPTPGDRIFTLTQIQDNGGTANGGQDTSTLSIVANIKVAPTNDAPVMDHVNMRSMSPISQDAAGPSVDSTSGSTLVSTLLGGISDADSPSGSPVPQGIAITATKYGTWFYSVDNGHTWYDVNKNVDGPTIGSTVELVSATKALLLSSTDRLYFQPNPNSVGIHLDGLIFYAWDVTSGSAGSKVPVLTRGGSSAFSSASDYVAVRVESGGGNTGDTIPPTISITSDKASLKAGETATLTFSLSENPGTNAFTSGDVSVSGGSLTNFTGSGTSYTATFTPDVNSNTNGIVSIASGVFDDAAGNVNADGADTNNTVTMTVDTIRPTISITSDKSSLKAGESAILTFTLSDNPGSNAFTSADVSVSGGALTNFTGSGTSYTATFTPTANSSANGIVSVASGVFDDAAGNVNADGADANNTVTMTVDTIAPTLNSIVDDKNGSSVAVNTMVTYTVTFNEDMDASTVSAADFGNAGTATVTIGTVTETTPGVFTVQATPSSAGTLQLQVNANAVLKDVAGNNLDTTTTIVDNTSITVDGGTVVTRLSSGLKIIPDVSTAEVQITEGTGAAANITLAAPTTTINTLTQKNDGGTTPATIDTAGQTLQVSSITAESDSSALTIGTTNPGTLKANKAGGTLTIANASTNPTTINALIANNTSASALTIAGSGTTILAGTNTYTGTTTISGGTLSLSGGLAIADTGPVVMSNAADTYLSLQANETIGSLSGGGLLGGNVLLNNFVLTTGGNNTSTSFAGIISGTAGGITKAGTGTLTLSGVNTYSGTTTISAGTLNANSTDSLGNGSASNTLIFSGGTLQAGGAIVSPNARGVTLTATGNIDTNSNSMSIAGVIAGSGGLTKSGDGALTLTGVNTYSGTTTISAGTLSTGTTGSLANGGAASAIGQNTNVAGNLILNGGTLQYANTGIAQSTDRLFSIQGGTTTSALDASGTNGITFNNTGSIAFIGSNTTQSLTLTGSGSGTLRPNLGNNGSGATSLMKSGSGTWTLSGANTYTGATTVNAGTLKAGVTSVAGTSGAFGNNSEVSMSNTLGAILDITGFNTQIGSLTGGGPTGGNVTLGAATLTVGGSTSPAAFAGSISGTGTLSITGGGTLSLSGTNTYTGTTAINGATLSLSGGSAIADTGSVNLANALYTTLSLQADETIGSLIGGGATGGNVSLTSFRLTTGGNNSSTSFAGVISGSGGITKTGTGTFTLTGTNSYQGSTTINGGTLTLSGASGSINNSASISINNNAVLTLANTSSTEGSFSRLKDTAPITSNGGTINYTNTSGASLTYAETIGSVQLNNGQTNIVLTANMVGGSGNAQTLTLSGLNTVVNSTGTVTFSALTAGPSSTINMIKVFGAATTTLNNIIGPWATTGTSATAQTDYAIYDASGNVIPAGIAGTAETTWTSSANVTLTGTTSLTQARNINSLRFTGAGALSLGNNNLQTNGILNGGTGSFSIASTGGVLQQTGTSAANIYLTSGNGSIFITAPIQDNTGALTLVKSGTSHLVLSGLNTYSGGVVLNAGNLQLDSNTALGSGPLTIFGGGVVSTINFNNANSNPITINADFQASGVMNLGTGAVSLGSLPGTTRTITAFGTLTLGGKISDGITGNVLTKAGSGSLILSGANDYSGGTTISSSTLTATSGSALGTGNVSVGTGAVLNYFATTDTPLNIGGGLSIVGGGTTAVGSSIGGALNSAMINVVGAATASGTVKVNLYGINSVTPMSGSYTLLQGVAGSTLSNASYSLGTVYNNTNFTVGTPSATANTLTVSVTPATALTAAYWTGGLTGVSQVWAASNGSSASNWFSSAAGSAQGLVPGSGTNVFFSANTVANAPSSSTLGANMSVQSLTQNSTTPTTLNADGYALTLGSGGITLNTGAGAVTINPSIVLNGTQTWTNNSSNTLTVGGVISGNGFGLTKAGTGTLALSGANTYTGVTNINGGILNLGSAEIANTSGPIGKQLSNANGSIVFSGGTLQYSSLNTNDYSGRFSAAVNQAINIDTNSQNVTFSTALISSGGTLTKSGAGTLTLSGANTYSGGTTLSSGTLVLNNGASGTTTSSAIGTGPLTISGGTINSTISGITLGTNNLQNWNGDFSFTGSQSLNMGTGAVNMSGNRTVTVSANTFTVGGSISGGGFGLTKAGTGTLTLTGGNTYSGTTTISAGTLNANSTDALGNGSATNTLIFNGGTLQAGGNITSPSTRSVTLSAAGNIDTNSNSVSIDGAITGTGALTKNGNGTLTLTNANANTTYSGTTTIVNGIINISNGSALGSGQINLNGPTATSNDALWLTGGITLANAINTAQTAAGNGVNNTGVVFSASGANTISGSITNSGFFGMTFGAASGATLNISALAVSNSPTFNAVGSGIINLNGDLLTNINPTKIGTGTLNVTTNVTGGASTAWNVNQGSMNISGAGQLSSSTGNIIINNNALLNVDDTTGGPLTRLGGARSLTLANGNFAYTGNGTSPSSQTFGALTANSGADKITLTNAGAANTTVTFASLAINSGAVLNFESAQTFNASTNRIVFSSTPASIATFSTSSPANVGINTVAGNGVVVRAIVRDASGTNFATYNGTGGTGNVQAYSTYTVINGSGNGTDLNFTNINGGSAYGINAQDANATLGGRNVIRVTADTTTLSNPGLNLRTTNALKIDGANTDVTFASAGGTQLAIATGMILSTAANQTIGNATLASTGSAPAIFLGTAPNPGTAAAIVFSSTEASLLVDTGADLTVNAALYSTTSVTKGLGGDLKFATKQYFSAFSGTLTINGGKVILAGGENTLWQGVQGSSTVGQGLAVGPGASLDLNANSQMVGNFGSPSGTAFAGSGGTIINSVASTTATLISVNAFSAWGGNISSGAGSIAYNKAGTNTQSLYSDNTYTGATLITGGNLSLLDEGKLSGTASIAINGGTLSISDTGTMPIIDRINNAAGMSMRGGIFNATGRDATNSSQKLGNVFIAEGGNSIIMTVGSSGPARSQVLDLGNITNGSGAMLQLNNMTGQAGTTARMMATNGTSLLVNGIVPWMNMSGVDLVSYVTPSVGNAAGGFAALNQVGYQGYDGTVLPATSNATGNYKVATAAITVPAGGLNINALVLTPSATQTITFGNGTNSVTDVLNLTAGELIKTGNFNTNIGAVVDNGRLTAGGTVDSTLVDLNLVANAATANPVVLNSRVVDNGTERVRLSFTGYNSGALQITNGANTYTGGTIVNTPNTSQTNGIMDLNVTGANGTTGNSAIPLAATVADSLIINGGNVRLLQANQINFGITPALRGQFAILQLNNNNQTLAGLNFDNDGGTTAPSLTTGTGILTLNGNITATSGNAGTVATISGAGAILPAAGATAIGVDLNGTTRFINAAPVTINGNTTVANVTPTLNISTALGSSSNNANTGLTLNGNGLVQLSSSGSLFGGGVNVNAGGLAVGASTNVSVFNQGTGVVSAFTSGPVGTGSLTIGNNVPYLTSTASANILSNQVILAGTNITLKGTNSLSLNGNNIATNLFGNTTVTVDAPQASLILNMVLADTNSYTLTKQGLGNLVLGNNNTFNGNITINAGTLTLAGLTGATASPVSATSTVTINNGGLLSLQNNGGSSNSMITYANKVIAAGSVSNLNIGNYTATNTSNTIVVNDLSLAGGNILNVSGTNSYGLKINNLSGDAVGGDVPQINVAAGTSVTIIGYSGDKPINVGQGSLLFPGILTIGSSTTFSTNPITLSGTYPLAINNAVLTAANMTTFGYTAGGLNASFATLGASPTAVVNNQVAGIGFTGNKVIVSTLADASFGNRPNTISGTAVNTAAAFSGFLQIATAGTYSFRSASDDGMTLYVDGNAVGADGFAHGFTDAAAINVSLTAGYHAIAYKFSNQGSGGGYRVLYSGADTGGANSFRTLGGNILGGNVLYGTTANPTAGNGYNGAAIINNDYALATNTTATIDTGGTQFGAVIDQSKNFTLGWGSALNITNGTNGSFATGWFGAGGQTPIYDGAIIATTNTSTASAGTLQLLGAIWQSGIGISTGMGANGALIKTGQGTLVVGANNSTSFTGDLVIQNGFVQLNNAAALPTGLTTVANNGAGVTQTMASTGTTAGSTSVTVPSTAALQAGMTVQNGTAGVIPTGAYIVSVDSTTTFTLSEAALTTNNTATLTFQTSGSLDLNGQTSVSGNVHINGAGNALLNTSGATSATPVLASGATGALWNSSGAAASFIGALTLDTSATVGGYGDLTLGVINSAASTVTLTKAGADTLFLNTANNTSLLGPIALTNGMIKIGDQNALGAATALATNGTTLTAGSVLDLNGQTTAEFLSIIGTGRTNFTAVRNTLGALVNSTTGTAMVNSPLVLSAAASVGSDWVNAVSGGTAGGDITLNGAISGALLTKVGSDTLTLTRSNTQSGLTITEGTVIVSSAGIVGGAGAVTVGTGVVTGITPTNTLTLDYAGNNAVNRLADNSALNLNGGAMNLIGDNTPAAVTESLGTGALAFANQHNLVTLTNNGANVTLSSTTTGALTRTNNATVFIRGTSIGSAAPSSNNTNILLGTAPAPATGQVGTATTTDAFTVTTDSGVMPWIVIESGAGATGGVNATFATYSAPTGLKPMVAGNFRTTLPTGVFGNGTTDENVRLVAAGTLVNAIPASFQTTGINSLTFNAATDITLNANVNLSIDSGGILASESNSIGGAGMLNAPSGREFLISSYGAAKTLTINTPLGGAVGPTTGGLTKAGDGSLVLSAANGNSYTGATTLNGGTVKFGAAAPANALFYKFSTGPAVNATASAQNADLMVSNSSSMLDLNGHSQVTGGFLSRGTLPGSGGIVTNTSTTATTYTTTTSTASDFAGQINGNLNFVRTGGANVLVSLRDNNQFTGNATFMSGQTTLVDQGRLSGTSGISIRNAVLRWDDSGIQSMNNRIANDVAITLDGGAFDYTSRGATTDAITLGNLSLTAGANTLRVNPGNGGFGVATLNLGGTFSRSIGATLNFTSTSTSVGMLGAGANVTAAATGLNANTNGMIGAWATVNNLDGTTAAANLEFAVYDATPGVGVRQMNNIEQTGSFALSTASSNVRLGANATMNNGGQTINSLTIAGATTVAFAGNTLDTLTLTSGGLLSSSDNVARAIGVTTNANTRGKLTSSASELFIHNGANTLTINADITGTITPVFTSGGLNSGAAITLNNANSYVGTAYVNGVILNLGGAGGTTTNAITGDLVVTGGNFNGTGSGFIANSAVVLNAANQINDISNVTIRGGSQLNLNGFNDTIASLRFNSQGGYNDGGPLVQTGAGRLTLTGAITSTNLDDVRAVPTINGNLILPATASIVVDRVGVNTGSITTVLGTRGDLNEQVGLSLNANIVNAGTINKTGLGALQLGGYSNATLTVNVNAGEVILGPNTNTFATNYKNTQINLANGTMLDMRGNTNMQVGSVFSQDTNSATSTAIIKNFNPTTAGTLVTGADSSSGTFAGTFAADYTTGTLNVTKIGNGTWTLKGDSSANILGTLNIAGSTAVNTSAINIDQTTGKLGFVTTNLAEGGALNLNSAGNVVTNRLGGSTSVQSSTANDRGFNNKGGVLNYVGGAAGIESLANVTNTAGQSQWNLTNSDTQSRINIATFTAASSTNTGSLVLNAGGNILGGGAVSAGRVNVIASTPNLVGNNPAVSGSKINGIRPDIIGIDSTGSGFVTHDANGYRLLATNEYQQLPGVGSGLGSAYMAITVAGTAVTTSTIRIADATGLVTGQTTLAALNGIPAATPISATGTPFANSVTLSPFTSSTVTASTTGRVTFIVPTTANVATSVLSNIEQAATVQSLTLNSTGGLLFEGGNLTTTNCSTGLTYGFNGALNTLTITSGGIVANGTNAITNGSISAAAAALDFHVLGTSLNVNSHILGSGGIVKSDAGLLTLSSQSYNTGPTSINDGTLQLGAGSTNLLLVAPTATVPSLNDVNVNSGFFDLNGSTQAVRQLTQSTGNTFANGAGTVTNSNASTATLITVPNTTTTFAGNINGGNIKLDKQGLNTLTLLSANNLGNGTTNIRGSQLILRDSGAISTSSLAAGAISALQGGQLTLDNGGLGTSSTRVGTTPITLTGGTLQFLGADGTDSANVGAITLGAGASVVDVRNFASSSTTGATNAVTLASITGGGAQSNINFTNSGGTLGAAIGGVNGSTGINQSANVQIGITVASTLTNGIIGGWAVVNGTDWASYRSTVDAATGAFGIGALGLVLNSTSGAPTVPFGAYSSNSLTSATVIGDNISDLTARDGTFGTNLMNSLKLAGAVTMTGNNLSGLITLGSGGLLNTSADTFRGIRLTAGTTANANLYNYDSATLTLGSQIVDNPIGQVNFVKSGSATLNFGTSPTQLIGTTTSNSNVIPVTGSTSGLVVGMTTPNVGNIGGINQYIIAIPTATTFMTTTNVGTGATGGDGSFLFPTVQVLSGLTLTNGVGAISVPFGTSIMPGSTLLIAFGNSGAPTVNILTVNSVSGTTLTLAGGTIGGSTGTGTIVFVPNATGLVSTPATVNVLTPTGMTVLSNTNLTTNMYVSGPGIAPGTIISNVTGNAVTLSKAVTANVAGNISFTPVPVGLTQISVPVTAGASTVTVSPANAAGIFAGQSVTGFGIPVGTVVSNVIGTIVTLSQNIVTVGSNAQSTLTFGEQLTNSTSTLALQGTTTAASATVTVGSTQGLYPGMKVTGIPGLGTGTIATIASATTFTLNTGSGVTAGTNTNLSLTSPTILPTFAQGYSGDTVVNQGTMSVGGTIGSIQIPGNLILNNANLTQTSNGNIASTSNVSINGGGVLTLTGLNTLQTLTYNNNGGILTPNVTGGTVMLAGSASASTATITSVNDNLATTPQFSSILELNGLDPFLVGGTRVITTSGQSPMDLNITGVVQNTMGGTVGLTKAGTGSLMLSATNTFNGNFLLNEGSLILNTDSAGAITSSPVGTGTLVISNLGTPTTIQAGTATHTIANPVTVNGDFTFGGTAASHNLILSGTVNLSTAPRVITVTSPQVTDTIIGQLTSGAGSGLTKSGDGTLVLSNTTNNYTGATIVNGGLLKYGAVNAIPTGSAVSVLSGGTLDINGGGTTVTLASLAGDSTTQGGLVTTSATSGTTTLSIGDGTNTAFGGAITNNIGSTLNFVKQGSSTLILGGPNSYSGTTTVSGGTLLINGSTSGGSVTVNTIATLGGTGTINGAVSDSGILSPGASYGEVGTLNVNGNVSFSSGSTLLIDVTGTTGDLLSVTGTVDATNLVLEFNLSAAATGTYTILSATAITNVNSYGASGLDPLDSIAIVGNTIVLYHL